MDVSLTFHRSADSDLNRIIIAYVAAKHGVVGMTKVAALRKRCKNIRMNSVAPGAIDTPMLRGALEQFGYTAKDYAPQLSHLNRFGRAEEIDSKVSKNLLFKI